MEDKKRKIQEQLKKVGKEFIDENGLKCRIIKGKKIIQLQNPTKHEALIQERINAFRASKYKTPREWINNL